MVTPCLPILRAWGIQVFAARAHPVTKLCDSRRFTYTAQPIIPPSTIYIAGEPKSDCLELGTETDHDSKEIGLRHLRNNLGAPINGVTRANCQSTGGRHLCDPASGASHCPGARLDLVLVVVVLRQIIK